MSDPPERDRSLLPSGRAPDLALMSAGFGQLLHKAGVEVTPERAGRFAAAVLLAAPEKLPALYWLGRVCLVGERAQVPVYDRVFDQVFRGVVDVAEWRGASPRPPVTAGASLEPVDRRPNGAPAERRAPRPSGLLVPEGAGGDSGGAAPEGVLAAMSEEERIGQKDFAHASEEELEEIRTLVRRLALVTPSRPSRRSSPSPRGRDVDLRTSLRRAYRTGGDPVRRYRRARKRQRRRLVLICDISGSMEAYARVYLHLLWSGTTGARAEAFVFATRLTRLTRTLRGRDADAALERAGQAAPDWSGGTRIGAALKVFNDSYGRAGMARGAVVVVLSDGWERADPALLGEEMARLARLAHRIVWVNPRRASPSFQPLTGGMAAALPHVDVLVSGHSYEALEEVLASIGPSGPPPR